MLVFKIFTNLLYFIIFFVPTVLASKFAQGASFHIKTPHSRPLQPPETNAQSFPCHQVPPETPQQQSFYPQTEPKSPRKILHLFHLHQHRQPKTSSPVNFRKRSPRTPKGKPEIPAAIQPLKPKNRAPEPRKIPPFTH